MMYVEDDESRIYKVNCNTLEESIELIHRYENYVYDLYGGETWSEDDTWGWWEYRKYEIVNYDDLDIGEEVWDLDNHSFEWCEVANLLIKTENGFKDRYENKKGE